MEKDRLKEIFKFIKLAIWLIPLVFLLWILNEYLVPGGRLEIKYDVTRGSKLVRNFASKEIDKLIGTKNKLGDKDYFQLITTSPVYFDVKVPRAFQKATVSLKYQNPASQPAINLGVKQANDAFYLQPLAFEHPVLENLPDYWDKIQEGDLVLWQKNKEYLKEEQSKQKTFEAIKKELDGWKAEELKKLVGEFGFNPSNQVKKNEVEPKKLSIDEEYNQKLAKLTEENKVAERPKPAFSSLSDFLSNLPAQEKIVRYNFSLTKYLQLADYKKNYWTIEINKSLRGKHEIYTYVGQDEDLNFTFIIQDINRHAGEDIFKVTVFNNQDEKVKEISLSDDGGVDASGKASPERTLQVLIEGIPHGLYRLVIDAPDDIFIKKIVTFQHLFAFKGNLYLTDNEEYKDILGDKKSEPTTVYTNSTAIKAITSHPASFQTLQVGLANLTIDKLLIPKEVTDLKGITSIISPENDVYLEGDGLFAFSQNQLNMIFDPVANLDEVTNIGDYDYIIASYPQAKKEGDWSVAKTQVTTPKLYFHKNQDLTASFIFDLPGLPENKRILKIKEVDVTFEKEPITIVNFFSKTKNWLQRNIIKK